MVDATTEESASNADAYALQAENQLHEAFMFVRDTTGKQAQRMKRYYDAAVKPRRFNEADFVLLYSPKKKRGLYSKWQVTWTGPFRVNESLNYSNYVTEVAQESTFCGAR